VWSIAKTHFIEPFLLAVVCLIQNHGDLDYCQTEEETRHREEQTRQEAAALKLTDALHLGGQHHSFPAFTTAVAVFTVVTASIYRSASSSTSAELLEPSTSQQQHSQPDNLQLNNLNTIKHHFNILNSLS
jgi:hypothetical protein